jgi:DNA ligase (NAD+)
MTIDIDSLTAPELAALIARWNKAYYNGMPAVSDLAWQEARDRLKKLDPENPILKEIGAKVDSDTPLKKRKHGIPMGSLSNAFEAEEISAWLKRVDKLSLEAGIKPPTAYVGQPKLDGFSLDLRYKDGVLVRAITRGDGIEGEDVTHNARLVPSIPKTLPEAASLFVRGEAVVHKNELNEFFPGAANTRNAAAGTMRRLDSAGAEHLRFYAFNVVDGNTGEPVAKNEQASMEFLEAWGFTVAPTLTIQKDSREELEIALIAYWALSKEMRERYPYDCDGAVIKVSNHKKCLALGESDSCPRGMLATKWRGTMVGEGTIVAVENQVGRSGAITPVAIFNPAVAVGGVMVTRSTLANWSIVENLGLCIGSKVVVERRGEVIPGVNKVISTPDGAPPICRPENCPCCGEGTVEDGPRQLCTNVDCPARVTRAILNFIAKMGIMYLAAETVDKLMCLDGPLQSIPDIYKLTTDQIGEVSGFAMAEKIKAEIDKSRTCTLDKVIGAVGIPGLGQTDAAKLVSGLGILSISEFVNVCSADAPWRPIKGIGPEKIQKVVRGAELRKDMLLELETHVTITQAAVGTGPLAGVKFCITGSTEIGRDELIRIFTGAGGIWSSSVTNDTKYLVMADANSTSIKAQAARKKGVSVISEVEALTMVGYTG